MEIFDTVLITYAIIITILSIYLYKIHGIEKVEELTKKVSIVATVLIIIMYVLGKYYNDEEASFLVTITMVVAFSLMSLGFDRKHLKLEQNEAPIKYFLLQLFFITGIGFMAITTIVAIISYILTGDGNAIAQGRW